MSDPDFIATWYKDAVIYQMHVRAFCDSDGDGIGDFAGLVEKLDYVRDLGVTAIWLLPFYPSPLKDDGYDIADYRGVHASYGTLRDFRVLLREAHRRDLRVITELVINHTSDQHEWFQRSRRAAPGSRWRNFYVWSDDPQRYGDARIIFRDFESSNWQWDPVAGAYYWHRFYKHQPDLNFDNPEVRQAVLSVLDGWIEMGVDGFRLDAVPYLYEREGTTCENLPETHTFLREVRQRLDGKYAHRMLLAEANQWPEDAAAYFGSGDECHMNFHFPLMPRLFMALQQEDRFPVIDILEQTPDIPENCQWGLFLRNHDELTLEMVTDEERDYMYRTYAEDRQARINFGIRRRLAPLLGNNRRKLELLNGLLFSLPGTPIVYYGDELGMGDNIYLGDRDSVRTPMQWSPDRNAGFSRANPQRLYLPVVVDPEFHFSAINVEAQANNPQSLLWWMRRLIALRKRHAAFGRGRIEFLFPDNAKVLAFLRHYGEERVLVVANLSRFAQFVELDLSPWQGSVPVELFGRTHFPPIGQLPYLLTLGPHTFYWFSLAVLAPRAPGVAESTLPGVRVHGDWTEAFRGRARAGLETALAQAVSERLLPGEERTLQTVSLVDAIPIREGGPDGSLWLVVLRAAFTSGEPQLFVIPLACADGGQRTHVLRDHPECAILRVDAADGKTEGLVYDATYDGDVCRNWFEIIAQRKQFKGAALQLVPSRSPQFRRLQRTDSDRAAGMPSSAAAGLAGETLRIMPGGVRGTPSEGVGFRRQCAALTDAIYGERFVLRTFRRVDAGISPDLEISRFLNHARRMPSGLVPGFVGALELQREDDEPLTLGILWEYVPNEGTAWEHALSEFGRYFERVLTPGTETQPEAAVLEPVPMWTLVEHPPAAPLTGLIGAYLGTAERIGERTANLHHVLASDAESPAFAPEPLTPYYQRGLYQSMRSAVRLTFRSLRKRLRDPDHPLRGPAEQVLGAESEILRRQQAVRSEPIAARRIRCHGQYRLGKLLFTGRDFVIIDFHGDPALPLGERRIKRSPLRDIASMICSFHQVARCGLLNELAGIGEQRGDVAALSRWAESWSAACAAAFLRRYLMHIRHLPLLPSDPQQLRRVLDAFLLDTAVHLIQEGLRQGDQELQVSFEVLRAILAAGA
jgi:maltose alpha-D-glucosyltransferase/alpha-amylase